MHLLCCLGIHKMRARDILSSTDDHDWYARVYGNILILKVCDRCGMHKRKAGYLPPEYFER